ncbi:MAG: SagB/ThcOx family dehydrogenase [Bacteroidetes bacterium]|nr:SagB/ThcOx family dehydrogenase [Bacteroidota bacterium]MCL1968897.1 SagB/ThcOx family dehydrogenase [Bacteroidota bacterium]MCL1969012.1 SagB/ThcOx family dehydrogenase [Bacteroidota bacterium]
MKKLFTLILLTIFTLSMNAQDIKLVSPQKKGGMPLMEALANRKTNRDFTQQELTPQQLSNLLWAAVGVNRPDGRRTAPTARNAQQIEIYVLNKKGAYLYMPNEHILKLVAAGDHRKSGASQERFQECPLMLILVANYDKMDGFSTEAKAMYEDTDAGNVSQNIYLYCASEGLATCALGSIHREKLQELLKYNGKAILGQSVGVAQ